MNIRLDVCGPDDLFFVVWVCVDGFPSAVVTVVTVNLFLLGLSGEVICEPPNNKLDKFTGTLCWRDNKYPLDNEKMLLRGCVLRNTEWCFGMVIFAGIIFLFSSSKYISQVTFFSSFNTHNCFPITTTGLQTKLMQNCGRTKFKRTNLDKLMNTLVLWVSLLLLLVHLALCTVNIFHSNRDFY